MQQTVNLVRYRQGENNCRRRNNARSDDLLKATVAQWDCAPLAINTPGVIFDLKTGTSCPAMPEDYCLKQTAVAPAPGEPALFLAFIDRIMNGDREMISYLRRLFGYRCTGITEHCTAFFYGTGANGKSVILSTISGILGDYRKTAPIETFTVQHGQGHPTDLAGVMGAPRNRDRNRGRAQMGGSQNQGTHRRR